MENKSKGKRKGIMIKLVLGAITLVTLISVTIHINITINFNRIPVEDPDPAISKELDSSAEDSDVGFKTETYVRLVGATDRTWQKSVETKVGDQVEFRIEYKNTSDKQQDHVAVKDILPSSLKYVDGTTVFKNSSHPKGATADHDYLVTTGTKIGSYGAGANAYIYFTAEVVDEDLTTGTNSLKNWGQAGVGEITIQDFAEVIVVKE